MGIYLVGGGALLAWSRPAPGFMETAACVALIMITALLDSRLIGARVGKTTPSAVSLSKFRNRKNKTNAPGALPRERRALLTVHKGRMRREAEALMALLRERGLSPIIVSSTAVGQRDEALFEVRLPSAEVPQARSLVQTFLSREIPE